MNAHSKIKQSIYPPITHAPFYKACVSTCHDVFSAVVASTITMLLTARSTPAVGAAPVDRIVLPQCLRHPSYVLYVPIMRGGARVRFVAGLALHPNVMERRLRVL